MTIFLDRFDTPQIVNNEFTYDFNQWLAVLVNVLNEDISDIQNSFNLLTAQSYIQTDIVQMFTDGLLTNGILLYDTTNDVYVGMQGGSLVQFTTTAYP